MLSGEKIEEDSLPAPEGVAVEPLSVSRRTFLYGIVSDLIRRMVHVAHGVTFSLEGPMWTSRGECRLHIDVPWMVK